MYKGIETKQDAVEVLHNVERRTKYLDRKSEEVTHVDGKEKIREAKAKLKEWLDKIKLAEDKLNILGDDKNDEILYAEIKRIKFDLETEGMEVEKLIEDVIGENEDEDEKEQNEIKTYLKGLAEDFKEKAPSLIDELKGKIKEYNQQKKLLEDKTEAFRKELSDLSERYYKLKKNISSSKAGEVKDQMEMKRINWAEEKKNLMYLVDVDASSIGVRYQNLIQYERALDEHPEDINMKEEEKKNIKTEITEIRKICEELDISLNN